MTGRSRRGDEPAIEPVGGRRLLRRAPATEAHQAMSLRAIPFLDMPVQTESIVLTARQREQLVRIGICLRLPARKMIYREDEEADSVFAIMDGVVKSYRELRSGRRTVVAFLFQRDLFGLAEKGRYVNCVQAVTPVVLYRLSVDQLTLLLKQDADLQFQFLAKVTHELRESQRQTIAIGRKDALGKLAMFIRQLQREPERSVDIELPMTRSDIASYLGLSLESVSRATRSLEQRGVVCFPHRHMVRIIDQAQFDRIESTL